MTLATAFALPGDFPQRDIVVLAAFAVVLATLVVQGLTLSPLIKLLGMDGETGGARDLPVLRRELASAALRKMEGAASPEAGLLRSMLELELRAVPDTMGAASLERYRQLALSAVAAQRERLEQLRSANKLNVDEYNLLLEEIDWRELAALPEESRRIEET